MGSSIGNAFGKRDSSATNDMLGGKVVATGTPGATTVADQNRGLDTAQIRNRKLLGTGGRALSGFSNPVEQGSGMGTNFNFADNQPMWQPPDYTTPLAKQNRNPFFG